MGLMARPVMVLDPTLSISKAAKPMISTYSPSLGCATTWRVAVASRVTGWPTLFVARARTVNM